MKTITNFKYTARIDNIQYAQYIDVTTFLGIKLWDRPVTVYKHDGWRYWTFLDGDTLPASTNFNEALNSQESAYLARQRLENV